MKLVFHTMVRLPRQTISFLSFPLVGRYSSTGPHSSGDLPEFSEVVSLQLWAEYFDQEASCSCRLDYNLVLQQSWMSYFLIVSLMDLGGSLTAFNPSFSIELYLKDFGGGISAAERGKKNSMLWVASVRPMESWHSNSQTWMETLGVKPSRFNYSQFMIGYLCVCLPHPVSKSYTVIIWFLSQDSNRNKWGSPFFSFFLAFVGLGLTL